MRALATILAALSTAAPPTGVHHTPAGTTAARRALIRLSDLGSGWSTATTPKKIGALTCAGTARTVKGVVETGSAVSPTFRQSATGPFVSVTTFVYGSAAQAARFWRHVSGRTALSCLAADVAGGSTKDVTFSVTQETPLPTPAGAGSVAYRVVGEATTNLQKVKVYVDVMLLQRGSAITEISWSSFSGPVAASTERALARAAARRL